MVGVQRERLTILVVEDQTFVRVMITDELRNAGFTVVETSNADEALVVLRHDSLDAHVLFSDVQMPGTIDGAELARLVRSEFPHLRVVLTSGIVKSIDGIEHDGFFPKPYQPADSSDISNAC